MSIRQKTFLICAGFAMVGLLTLVVLVRLFFGSHMENVERQAFTRDAQRMVRAVAYEVDAVSDFTADWAEWDDMYAYLQDGNEEFEEANLTKSVFQQQKLNWMALGNKDGKLLFYRTYDGEREMFWPAAIQEQELVRQVLARAAKKGPNSLSGVLRLPQGPLLFSIHRVMDSKKTVQGDGWLFMGRYLGAFQGGPIQWTVDGQVSWSAAEGAGVTAWLDEQGYKNVPFRLWNDEEKNYAEADLADVSEDGYLQLHLEEARQYYQQSLDMFWKLVAVLAAMMVLGGVGTYFLMEWLVLRRVTRLTRYLETIQDFSREFSALPVKGNDEIAVLTKKLQQMLQQLWDNHQQMQYLGWYDGLTGVRNRLAYEADLQQRAAASKKMSLGVILFDIDGLKLVNDALGHNEGDQLLRQMVRTVKNVVQDQGELYRIGGDEFIFVTQGMEEERLHSYAEMLRRQLEFVTLEGGIPFSVSIGFAWGEQRQEGELSRSADRMMYGEKLFRQHSRCNEVVQSLREALAARDHITEGHASRLGELALAVARRIESPLESLGDLRLLAEFHDVGKIGIPDRILNKPGRLEPDEWEEMRKHSEIGYRIAQATPTLQPIASFILHHHEWWDGQGYPLGLAGEEIPLACRILSIVDAYDAMTNDRPYRKAMSKEEALAELRRGAGRQFDARLVTAFEEVLQ